MDILKTDVRTIALKELKNNTGQIEGVPANPRVLRDDAYKALVQSLQADNLTGVLPLKVIEYNGEWVVLGGNMRLRALKEIGAKEVECIVVPADTDADTLRKIVITDNSTFGEWDNDMLANEWDVDELKDWGVELPEVGVDTDPKEAHEDDFDEEKDKVETVCKKGDIWLLGQHRLMCGDSTNAEEVVRLMDGNRAAILMTDPPYGINAEKMTLGTGERDFHRGDWDSERPDISLAIANADKHCIWGGNYFADRLPVTNDWLCWHKKNDGLSFSEFELAWTDFGKNCRILSHHWGSEKKLHPTMKPIAVIAWALDISKTQGSVLDLFGGSGSTLIACEQLNRKCYMMELDPHYCDVIIARWEKLTGRTATRL